MLRGTIRYGTFDFVVRASHPVFKFGREAKLGLDDGVWMPREASGLLLQTERRVVSFATGYWCRPEYSSYWSGPFFTAEEAETELQRIS